MKYLLSLLIFFLLLVDAFAQEPAIPDSLQNLNTNFHFQLTTVTQHKYAMHAPYTGTNSLTGESEDATTLTSTIFWGIKLWENAAFYINPEVAGGSGISGAHGIAGFTNGEAFRVGNPSPTVYAARAFFQQTFSFSDKQEFVGEGANDVYKTRSVKYLDVILGKFSVADYFDKNRFSHDPRSQFLNWSLMSTGAWDYPANVRGYTIGFVIEYGTPTWSWRVASVMVPEEANGNKMDTQVVKANSSVMEIEKPFNIGSRLGVIRLLGFYTQTHMGNYQESIMLSPVDPDITTTRKYGRTKYGFGLNLEQELSKGVGMFMRASWNDGKNETWAFTEIDRSVSMGFVLEGSLWKRSNDLVGIGSVVNGLSTYHRDYLAAGGLGFIIGDGKLNYANEWATEIFYKANLFSDSFFVSPNFHFVVNPAYNKDRGPATIVGVRVHVEF